MVISAINAWHGNRDPGGQYTAFSDNEGEAMRAALTAVAPMMQAKVADGWKLVPVESTDAMHLAYINEKYRDRPAGNSVRITELWSAMLAAAPEVQS
jgi:hypothetical protein